MGVILGIQSITLRTTLEFIAHSKCPDGHTDSGNFFLNIKYTALSVQIYNFAVLIPWNSKNFEKNGYKIHRKLTSGISYWYFCQCIYSFNHSPNIFWSPIILLGIRNTTTNNIHKISPHKTHIKLQRCVLKHSFKNPFKNWDWDLLYE